MLAVVAEEILGKGEIEDVAELLGHLEIVFDVDAEPLEFVGLVAGADAEHQPPVRQRVGGRDLGGEPRRVVERQDHDRGAEPDLLRDRGAVRDHHQRRRAQAVIREMVLGEPGDRVAELVGEPRLLGDLGENLRGRLFRVARPHQVEDAEFHRPLLRVASLPQPWPRKPEGVKHLSFGWSARLPNSRAGFRIGEPALAAAPAGSAWS